MARGQKNISVLAMLLTCAVLYGIYLLFTSSLARPELYAGIGAAVVATVAAEVFGVLGIVRFRPSVKEVLEAWRIPWYLIEGTYEIFKRLGQQLFTRQGAQSLVRAVPFAVGEDDRHSAARRALAVIYTTMTPNFIVLGIAHKQALLLYHQILPGDVLQMTINLGAQP